MKQIIAFVAFCTLLFPALSQFGKQGVLPFTGLQFKENRIYPKKVEVELEDAKWISNKLPVESTFKVKLIEPRGFSIDKASNYHPNITLLIVDEKGDTVAQTDKFMGEEAIFPSFNFDNLSMSLGFKPGTPLGKYTVFASFYDELFPASFDIVLNLELVDEPISNFTTDWHHSYTSDRGYHAETIEAELSSISCNLDSIKYNNTLAVSMKIFEIKLPLSEMKKGTSTFTIYDENLNVVPLESLKYAPKIDLDYMPTANYNPNSNFWAYIVFPVGQDYRKYTFRWQWESVDKKEKIDYIARPQ